MKRKTDIREVSPCVCKLYPLVAPGRKVQCRNRKCLFFGWKFADVSAWNEFQQVRFVNAAVKVGRALGIFNL